MQNKFRWTFLLTLLVASLVAAPLASVAKDFGLTGPGTSSFGVRTGKGGVSKTDQAGGNGVVANRISSFARTFEPVLEGLGPIARGQTVTSDSLATPGGFVRIGSLSERPRFFRMAIELAQSIDAARDAFLVHFDGSAPSTTVWETLQKAGLTVLGYVPNNAYVVTGGNAYSVAAITRSGGTVLAWTPGLFVDPSIGVTPMPTESMAANPQLNMIASVFPGASLGAVTEALTAMGGTVRGEFNGFIYFTANVNDLRLHLDDLTGLPVRSLSEQSVMVSADEDTNTGIMMGEFNDGRRPYTTAGIDGSSQVIGITDTGLSLDAAPFAQSLSTPGTPAVGHRKVVAYVTASSVAGGGGDLLSCDGTSGATHGHLVASLAAGNASALIPDMRVRPGFESSIAGTATAAAVDGVAPNAKVYFIDDQVSPGGCAVPEQILSDAQAPGSLSGNASAARTFGIANSLTLKIHNFSFSDFNPPGSPTLKYSAESQDIDTFLRNNQDYLVVVAAGNRGVDSTGDGNLDFGSITSPATAKNVVSVGSSGYPNNEIDPGASVLPNITNNGIGMVSRFGDLASSQGPAAFTTQPDGAGVNWRMKPDVMAPGDENLDNQRLTSPATCVSTDNDQSGTVECARLLPGIFFGTSFSAASVSGAAAVIRDYFAKGYAPAGQSGGAAVALDGPEVKAALIASAELMTGNPSWRELGGQLQLAFYTPHHQFPVTPEQGYGRVQLNNVLPLSSEPSTPSYVQAETISLATVGTTVDRTFKVVNPTEEMRCAASWYDVEGTVGVDTAGGNLVRDIDMTVNDCGADAVCGNSDDVVYYGNNFSEDSNFDGNLLRIADVYKCSITNATCNPDSPTACNSGADGTCNLITENPSEDCNGNGLLDFNKYSLPVNLAALASATKCDTGARDRTNNNEAVFLGPDELIGGHVMRVSLKYESATTVGAQNVGLVCTGGVVPSATGGDNSIRASKPEYSCNDVLTASVVDGDSNATAGGVSSGVTFVSKNSGGTTIDSETLIGFTEEQASTRYTSDGIGVSSNIPAISGDNVLSVVNGGSVQLSYVDAGNPTAVATSKVRCSPSLSILNITRRGTNANFSLGGGCDPRDHFDPRGIIYGLIPGFGTSVLGDNFLDKGETLTYSVAFSSQENGVTLTDAKVNLTACAPGTISGSSCTPASGVTIASPTRVIGSVPPGRSQVVTFQVQVDNSVSFPNQIQMLLQVSASFNGLSSGSQTVFNHVLNVDSFDDPALPATTDGVFRYSTDFPTGGKEVRVLAAEFFDPLSPLLAAQTFTFDNATVSGAGLLGNSTLLGFNSTTGNFDTPIANNWPWTFDTNNEGFAQRRRFDSDPGDNLELATQNAWQWNNNGECGFQSNAVGQTDGQAGQGGIWHTGFARNQAGTPPGRVGYDINCEDHEIPGSADPKREIVLDVVSSPIFRRVHIGRDSNGFTYTLNFTRHAYNKQFSGADGNAIFAEELDPDTTTPQPVSALDFGWLNSDQGTSGFLEATSQGPYPAFNPNNPHRESSALQTGAALVSTPGATQNIAAIHGPGSVGPFYEVGNPNKSPARSLREVAGALPPSHPHSGRDFGLPEERGAAGLPLRNEDFDLEQFQGFSTTFEDIYGPNETGDPAQTYPITAGNPQLLINRRDNFQVNFIAELREGDNPAVAAVPSYGWGIDDVVDEWTETHPVVDRTPCSNPATWTPDGSGTPSAFPNLAGGCGSIAWDRSNILDPETTLTLSVIDGNAQYGPDGIDQPVGDPNNDDQSNDLNGDGFAEIDAFVNSDVDLTGETFHLAQVAFASPVYQGNVRVSSTSGLSSPTDGVIFIQENGDGSNPVAVNAQYVDADINVSGINGDNVPCPDARIATVLTQFRGWDVLFVTAKVSDIGPNADGDLIADPAETVKLDIQVVNSIIDEFDTKPDLQDVTISLSSKDPDVACILDGTSFYGTLLSGIPKLNPSTDGFSLVISDTANRSSVSDTKQAEFTLGIKGRFTDGKGDTRLVSSFATPQRFAINLDLNVSGSAAPLISNKACVGGTNSGRACTTNADCPGLRDTDAAGNVTLDVPATCDDIPTYLKAGGTSPIAGGIGYFEGFEGSVFGAGTGLAGGQAVGTTNGALFGRIKGNSFAFSAALNTVNAYTTPLTPGAVAGNGRDNDPPGSHTGVDGARCQYNDPQGPSKPARSQNSCRPSSGTDWHVTDRKAFNGFRSLRGGTSRTDTTFDAYHLSLLTAAFSAPVNVGVSGGAALSIQHIAQLADDRTFNVPDGNTADRATVQVAEVDPSNPVPWSHTSAWRNISAFQNNYGNTGVLPFFINCIFDSYDDFYDAADALGSTPGFKPAATSSAGVTYNADNVSSEDDYFDPNDPQRLLGPSSSCFPQFAFASIGDYTSSNPANNGKAFTLGATGSKGSGVWVNSIFSLDNYGGKTIKVRFGLTGIELGSPSSFPRWDTVFGNRLGNAFRGWNIDDVAMSGLVSSPLTLVVDGRTGLTGACPVDPDPSTPGNQAACGTVTANAGPDTTTAVTGALVTLDAAASFADTCVDGFLEYRWRVGGTILQDYSTNSELKDTPSDTTVYTVDVRCSSDPACSGSDSAAAIVSVPFEAAPPTSETALRVTGHSTGFPTGGSGQSADLKGCFIKDVSFPNVVRTIVVNLNHNGVVMRNALGASGCDDSTAALNTALFGAGMSFLGNATQAGSPGTGVCSGAPTYTEATFNDTTMHVGNGEVVGYLFQKNRTVGVTTVLGTLGQGQRCGNPGAYNRGSTTVTTAPTP